MKTKVHAHQGYTLIVKYIGIRAVSATIIDPDGESTYYGDSILDARADYLALTGKDTN